MTDEVNHHGVNTVLVSPLDPVSGGRLNVTNPEATKQSRVHIVNVVLSTVVNGSDDTRIRVKLVRNTVLIVTKLTVQDQLEG